MGDTTDMALSKLLARLYAGLQEGQPWRDFLQELARWMDASFATLIITAGGKRRLATFLTPGSDTDFEARYAGDLFELDPFKGFPDGQVVSYTEFMDALPASAFAEFRAAMAESGFDQILGVDLRFGEKGRMSGARFEARFRISRHCSIPDFTAADRARLQILVPHLRIAVGLFERLEFAGAKDGVFDSTAQGLGLALIILDRDCKIVSANGLANHLLSEGEGIFRKGEEILFSSPEHRQILHNLLASEGSPALPRFRVDRPNHGDLVVTARPINLQAIHAGTGALALILSKPGPEALADLPTLRNLLGLSMAEARLAAILAEGLTLVEAARRLGIAHNTAKVQLRSVFAKTGVHRQPQLVALLASLNG